MLLSGEQTLQHLVDRLLVVFVNGLQVPAYNATHGFFSSPAEDLPRSPGPPGDAQLPVPLDDPDRRVGQVCAQPAMRTLQLSPGLVELGNVPREAYRARRVSFLV